MSSNIFFFSFLISSLLSLSDVWNTCWGTMLIQEWETSRVTVQCIMPRPTGAHSAWNWCVLLPHREKTCALSFREAQKFWKIMHIKSDLCVLKGFTNVEKTTVEKYTHGIIKGLLCVLLSDGKRDTSWCGKNDISIIFCDTVSPYSTLILCVWLPLLGKWGTWQFGHVAGWWSYLKTSSVWLFVGYQLSGQCCMHFAHTFVMHS